MSKLEELLLSLEQGETIEFSRNDYGVCVETKKKVSDETTWRTFTTIDTEAVELSITDLPGYKIVESVVKRDLHRVRFHDQVNKAIAVLDEREEKE